MNSCEPMLIARRNLRPGRGRSLETLTRIALRNMRAERKCYDIDYTVKVDGKICAYGKSLRRCLIVRHRIRIKHGKEAEVIDARTGIRIA